MKWKYILSSFVSMFYEISIINIDLIRELTKFLSTHENFTKLALANRYRLQISMKLVFPTSFQCKGGSPNQPDRCGTFFQWLQNSIFVHLIFDSESLCRGMKIPSSWLKPRYVCWFWFNNGQFSAYFCTENFGCIDESENRLVTLNSGSTHWLGQ